MPFGLSPVAGGSLRRRAINQVVVLSTSSVSQSNTFCQTSSLSHVVQGALVVLLHAYLVYMLRKLEELARGLKQLVLMEV